MDADLGVVLAFVALALLVALGGIALRARGRSRERTLLDQGLDPEERRILDRAVPLSRHLDPSQRRRWEGAVRLFLSRTTFVPCRGARDDLQVRLSVAGQACLLLAGRPDLPVYPELSTVYLHPSTYVRRDEWAVGDGLAATDEQAPFDGESWDRGAVVLSVRAVLESARVLDGFNVVIHEFAHQFDALAGGVSNGAPPMDGATRQVWPAIMDREFRELDRADRAGEAPFLDPYGAESPQEFFAVAVEAFFELGLQFRAEHPELHGLFAAVFGLDPARW